jgi:hypothetical protein
MYELDKTLALPALDSTIWRFMPLPALLSLLQRKQIFFAAITHMQDPFEGHMPWRVLQAYMQWVGFDPEDEPPKGSFNDRILQNVRRITCVNCWHINPAQSAAMWHLYSAHHGVAIKTTVRRLIDAFQSEPTKIIIGSVQYVDFRTPAEKEAERCLSPFFVKRRSFEHEKELRAVSWNSRLLRRKGSGMYVNVDLPSLIEDVYVSPTVEGWIVDVVRTELTLHGLTNVKVIHSKLYSRELE